MAHRPADRAGARRPHRAAGPRRQKPRPGIRPPTPLRPRGTGARRPAPARGPLDVVVVGAGFIGMELAATAREAGHRVTVVEALPRVMARAATPEMSDPLVAAHRDQGVRVDLQRKLVALRGDGRGQARVVELDAGERLPADLVAVGVGVLPNAELAVAAGLRSGTASWPTSTCAPATAPSTRSVTAPASPARTRGAVFCFRAGRLVAVESVNRPADHMISRRLPAGDADLTPEEAAAPAFGLKARARRPQTA
ncbi:FAD-dependent oxidoreductase [Streptomyces sp. NPDC002734]|uniref:FAD-dependent oxidoreductase n=1 Tax=Streptomyces sp. NPDC002734 TaxID=3154426 RepID=UPI00332FD4B0